MTKELSNQKVTPWNSIKLIKNQFSSKAKVDIVDFGNNNELSFLVIIMNCHCPLGSWQTDMWRELVHSVDMRLMAALSLAICLCFYDVCRRIVIYSLSSN